MKVTMQNIPAKKFFINDKWIGDFERTDSWKGFEEWKDKQGRKLYVLGDDAGFNLFAFLDPNSEQAKKSEGSIICGHPDLMAMIQETAKQ